MLTVGLGDVYVTSGGGGRGFRRYHRRVPRSTVRRAQTDVGEDHGFNKKIRTGVLAAGCQKFHLKNGLSFRQNLNLGRASA